MAEEGSERVAVDEVPPHLCELIPLAEEWGVWHPQQCDEMIEARTADELRPFVETVERHRPAIDAWLETMPKDMAQWPKAAVTFLHLVRNWHEAACELHARETHGGEADES